MALYIRNVPVQSRAFASSTLDFSRAKTKNKLHPRSQEYFMSICIVIDQSESVEDYFYSTMWHVALNCTTEAHEHVRLARVNKLLGTIASVNDLHLHFIFLDMTSYFLCHWKTPTETQTER